MKLPLPLLLFLVFGVCVATCNAGDPDFSPIPAHSTIDPARVVHPNLTKKITVEFDEIRLDEFAKWLAKESGLEVKIDVRDLGNEGLSATDTFSDRLVNAPLYRLLWHEDNLGLQSLAITARVDAKTIMLASELAAKGTFIEKSHEIGNLLESGFDADSLINSIMANTQCTWKKLDGMGGFCYVSGNQLVIFQTHRGHQEVAGLLLALREQSQEVSVLEPEMNFEIRRQLAKKRYTVNFEKTHFSDAIKQLRLLSGINIQINESELVNEGYSGVDPVTLDVKDQRLDLILAFLCRQMDESTKCLTTIVQNGAITVTTTIAAEEVRRSSVFKIGDFCKSVDEARSLKRAIYTISKEPWLEIDGGGGIIIFPLADTMIVSSSTENQIIEVRKLLSAIRSALQNSPNHKDNHLKEEFSTQYYALNRDLTKQLPSLLRKSSLRKNDDGENPQKFLFIDVPIKKSSYSVTAVTARREEHQHLKETLDRVSPQKVLKRFTDDSPINQIDKNLFAPRSGGGGFF